MEWKLDKNLDKWIGLLRVEVKDEQEFGLLNCTIGSWSEIWTGIWTNDWTIESWSERWTGIWTIELYYWQVKWKLKGVWTNELRVEVKDEQDFGLVNWTIESWSERWREIDVTFDIHI